VGGQLAAWLAIAATALASGCGPVSVVPDASASIDASVSIDPPLALPDAVAERDARTSDVGPRPWGLAPLRTEGIPAPPGMGDVFFGDAVDLDRDVLVVGWPRATVTEAFEAGAAFIFRRGEAGWALEATLLPEPAIAYGNYGRRVAVSGDTVLVAADGNVQATSPAALAEYEALREATGGAGIGLAGRLRASRR